MNEVAVRTPMQYLDKAVGALRDVGVMPTKIEPVPINALLQQISDLNPEKIAAIARTLSQASVFNEVVRNEISGMEIGERYKAITEGFNSIRDDAKRMVDQLADSKLDVMERATNVWMKIARGDIADRFDQVKAIYLDVTKATKGQIDREHTILEAYRDYRGALKQSEILALEVLKTATEKLDSERAALKEASDKVANFAGSEPAERASLELERDEQLRRVQDEEKRYQIAKDLSDNLTISYNTSEVVMVRLQQTTNAKERIYAQSISFFSTEQLRADGTEGVVHRHVRVARVDRDPRCHEGGRIEVAGDALRNRRQGAGGGDQVRIRPDRPRRRREEVPELRDRLPGARTGDHRGNAQGVDPELSEIRDAVEDGKRQISKLVADGKALPL